VSRPTARGGARRGPVALLAALGPLLATSAGAQADTEPAVPQAVDTARIRLEPDEAIVELRIPNTGGRVEAVAMALPGQTLAVLEVVREGVALLDATLTVSDQIYRFVVDSGAPVSVRYRITGGLDRIPLFVPSGGAELTVVREVVESHLVRLTGDAEWLDRIETETSMPRFERTETGLEVRLSSLPSFVRLSAGGPGSFARLADAFALLLVVAAAGFAYRRLAPRLRDRARGDGG